MEKAAFLGRSLDLAFRTARFLHADRRTALAIVTQALTRLEVAVSTQERRLQYEPKRRRRSGNAVRNRVALTEGRLLQQLVFAESEPYERRKENDGAEPASEREILVYFIKHLVQIACRRNAFYAVVGLARVLHDYTTPQAVSIHDLLTQDPDRARDDDYWRSAKKRVMESLKTRFGARLKTCRGPRGEERFKPVPHGERLRPVVDEALETFTPWDTACEVPAGFKPLDEEWPALSSRGLEEDEVELRRIHAVLHPACWRRLIAALALDPPERRLSVPDLHASRESGAAPHGGARAEDPAPLPTSMPTPQETRDIEATLRTNATRRKSFLPSMVTVKVDGHPRCRWSLDGGGWPALPVENGALWLDVVGDDAQGELPLVSCPLPGPDIHADVFRRSIVLEGGQRLVLTLEPGLDRESWQARLEYAETTPVRRTRRWARRAWRGTVSAFSGSGLTPLGAAAAMAIAIATVGHVLRSVPSRTQEWALRGPNGAPPPMPAAAGRDRPAVSPPAVSTQEPASPDPAPVPRLRGGGAETRTDALAQVDTLVLQVEGDWTEELTSALLEHLGSGGRFRVTARPEEADAALKVNARGSLRGRGDVRTVELTARCVGPDGRVLWPARGEAVRTRGPAADAVRRLVQGLLDAAGAAPARPLSAARPEG